MKLRFRGRPVNQSGTYVRIYAVVRRIPRGKVASYGQVARLAGLPGRARQVGYAMHALPAGTRVPWHRVVNAQGKVSRRRVPGAELTQRMLLEQEGVRFAAGGRIPLARYGFNPREEDFRARRATSTACSSQGRRASASSSSSAGTS